MFVAAISVRTGFLLIIQQAVGVGKILICAKKIENAKIADERCRAVYIPFNGGMVICLPCCDEWEKLRKPDSIAEYHEAVYERADYRTNLIAKE